MQGFNKEKADEISEWASINGKQSAANRFGIAPETVSRYIRYSKEVILKNIESPKILVFDIETLFAVAAVFNVWNVNIAPVNILQDWSLLSYSYKWLFEKEVNGEVMTQTEAWGRDDKRITEGLWKVLDEADIVIGYNSIKFDERRSNAKFLEHGLRPPSPYKSIDLYKSVKSKFEFTYGKLDWVNKILGLDRKLEHAGISLWKDCHYGKVDALAKMLEYNMIDTEITEELYLKIREWIPNHPNLALYYSSDEPICHKCGSIHISLTTHKHVTSASVFDVYECANCHSYSRAKKRSSSTELRPI